MNNLLADSNWSDKNTTIQELRNLREQFITDRGWNKHQKPRSLAISIVLEAAELMEHFQWEENPRGLNKQEIANELGDVLAYCFGLAQALEIDIATAFRDKIAHSAAKYPTELFNPKNENLQSYKKIKKDYRAQKGKK